MRKRRADSKLFSLPEKAQRDIYRMAEGTTLAEAVAQLALPEEMGGYEVEVSESSLSGFCKHWRIKDWRDQLEEPAKIVDSAESELSEDQRSRLDRTIMDGVREIIIDGMSGGQIDAKSAKSLVGLILKAQAQQLDQAKFQEAVRKAEAFDALEKAADAPGGLTPETLSQIREKAGLL